jgi:DNA polymerase IV
VPGASGASGGTGGAGGPGATLGARGHRTILHVDMDSFYASVELLRRPELRGRPVVVGGSGDRGVVAAASYEARAFGIHSAMPSSRARRLCPHAVFLPGDHRHYAEVSERVMGIFRSMTPLVEPLSLDEAFLDVTGARRLHGDGPRIARSIRAAVLDQEGLTCSVGVAPTKLLAKLGSQAAKPRARLEGTDPGPGVVVVEPGGELAFLHPLPVQALWGVGPKTLEKMHRLGITTVGDLARTGRAALVASLGDAAGTHLHLLAQGHDPRPVEPHQRAKSIGHEETFARDHHRHETLHRELVRQCDAVASRLRAAGVSGRTVTLKVRFHDFRTITRSVTPGAPLDTAHALLEATDALLARVDPGPGVRLLGVHVSGLAEGAARQLSLEDLAGGSWDDASSAVDEIRARFGADAIVPASLAGPEGIRIKRRGDQQWGPGDLPPSTDAGGAPPDEATPGGIGPSSDG